ncbi:DUF72 domain-containing protein [Nitrosomonas sp. Nm34]|uniref:DUF72 domain-containing protein n=1 Tax=Nitrosomonas sp. Nm34 TaxID=1881055 RepID=UPI0008EAE7FE|nr:DUF72 domain-containing protein [Nitrosomonas sp. Nm34]SFI45707.1 Uncharacterized conserved protein YecE, DUF72 family [Nitrosomonas sp. Nm34]
MMESTIFIGTSGWSYSHWRDLFYPPGFSQKEWLCYYAKYFKTVEINNSFYQLPDKKTLLRWYDIVPKDFIFTVKASRYITHIQRLNDPKQSTETFLERIRILEDKLGPILFQLPPRWHFNPERLSAFLETLSNDFRYVFEFRDPSWHNAQTYQLLSLHKAAFCIFDLDGFLSPREITTDLIYVRLHGPNGPYEGSYSKCSLSDWANTFANWSARGHTVYCYFDNTKSGYAAAQNALTLQTMLHSTQ